MITENPVPETDLNAELPEMESPVQDEVMTVAKKEWKIGLLVFGVFVVMLGGTVWAFQKSQIINSLPSQAGQISNKTMEIPKEVPVESVVPEASVKPVYAVFNGSGISGAASKLKAKIEAAGYEVVDVGNTETVQNGTTVEISNLVSNQKDEILQIIGTGEYVPLRDTSLKYSVKVIIGK